MSDKPISPLRQRMIDDMTARRFTEDTQRDYVRNVRNFAAFLKLTSRNRVDIVNRGNHRRSRGLPGSPAKPVSSRRPGIGNCLD